MDIKDPGRFLTHWLPASGIISVVLYYAVYLYQHALNIPFADDIHDIHDVLLFVTEVFESHQWTHTVELFFTQINDHRTLASRLVYYLAFILEGEVNFRSLILIGNAGLALLLWMLYLPIRQHANVLLLLLPAAMILFQLRLYATSFWAMNAFAFLFVFVYGFASLICLNQLRPARFVAAIVFATLATFTLASGQLIWIVGFVCIMHQVFIVRRALSSYVIAWIFAAAAVLVVFRIDYQYILPNTVILGTLIDAPRETALFFSWPWVTLSRIAMWSWRSVSGQRCYWR